jgi:hypothetical protein
MSKTRSTSISINLVALTATTIASTTIASTLMASTLSPSYAQAEAQKEIKIATNESELIRTISRDAMLTPVSAPNKSETSQAPANPSTDSQIIRAINVELGQSKPVITSDRTPSSLNAQNVTSVSQLSDVKLTDWAFTALQSLVERYGCIAGFPNKTYRGNQATSRYEFAAGVNACLDKINEIISSGLADKVGKEDLATLKKLQEEFATLRGRVDALDTKTAKLEAQQFSTTTKLFGQAIIELQGRFANTGSLSPRNGIRNTADDATNLTFGYNLQLSLVTQFDNRSLLLTGIQAGNASTASIPISGSANFLTNIYTRLGYELDTANSLSTLMMM